MLKPTNDPIDVLSRKLDKADKAAKEAARAGGTEAFQAVRKLERQVVELRQVQDDMIALFNAMPQNDGRQENTSGWTVDEAPAAGSWKTVATATIPRPANMNRVAVMASGNVSGIINNAGSSGSPQGRIVITGVASTATEGSSEYRGQQVRGIIQTSYFREFAPGSTVLVELQVRGRMSEFAASNTAALTVSAGFTRVGR